MIRMLHVLFRSFLDLFRPRMLMLLFLPPIAALLFWGLFAYFFWDQLLVFSQFFSQRFLFTQEIPPWLIEWFSVTPEGVATFLAGMMAIALVIPLTFLTSVLLTSVLVMPVVLQYMGKVLPEIEKKGSSMLIASTGNLIKASLIYLVLWVLTLPLWAIPGMSFAIPLLLNGYLNYRLFVFDSLGDYASPEEIQSLLRKKKIDFLLMGVIVSALLLFPPLFFIVPIYSALCFARLTLLELQEFRQEHP